MGDSLTSILRNRMSAMGVALTTASALIFLALVALDFLGYLENPYAGIVVFIMVPAFFVFGLLLIPFGMWLERRHPGRAPARHQSFSLSDPNVRRTAGFIVIATIVNLAIVSFASFGAIEYSESQGFCGQTCHPVMTPEFTAHGGGPHARVECVACHVGPGAGAFLSAKFNGSRQLWLVASHSYRRPIPVPVHDLPTVAGTCEQCHWPDRYIGEVTKVFYELADDAANTPTVTTVRLRVGGAVSGTGGGSGIHWHMNRSNVVEYVALDEAREQIPYVRTTGPDGTVREYFAEGVTPETIAGRPRRRMDCTDCHNRAAHSFGTTPERAVDKAIGRGPHRRQDPVHPPRGRARAQGRVSQPGGRRRADRTGDSRGVEGRPAERIRGKRAAPFDRRHASDLPAKHFSGDEHQVGLIRQPARAYDVERLLPLSRRGSQDARWPGDQAGMRELSLHRVKGSRVPEFQGSRVPRF
jgi:nitrate/TMAO reductase-like tetraheme cytochrome c subunit